MAKISRRNFMRGAAMGTMGAAAAGLLTACGNTASSTTSAPASSAYCTCQLGDTADW